MRSPPCMNVADVAITSLTVMYFFFNAFFNADFVEAAMKIPTPYSCNRIEDGIFGTICVSTELIIFLIISYGLFAACRFNNLNITNLIPFRIRPRMMVVVLLF